MLGTYLHYADMYVAYIYIQLCTNVIWQLFQKDNYLLQMNIISKENKVTHVISWCFVYMVHNVDTSWTMWIHIKNDTIYLSIKPCTCNWRDNVDIRIQKHCLLLLYHIKYLLLQHKNINQWYSRPVVADLIA